MNPLNYMRLYDCSSENSYQHWTNASNGKIRSFRFHIWGWGDTPSVLTLRPSPGVRASIVRLLQHTSEVGEAGCSQWTNRMLLRHRWTSAAMADRGTPRHREDAMVREQ